ncbi:hypothetical protein ACFODL_15640 [Phenylobacterium terrae]|uniref:Uncharacterized protein n=1 Tax=Phenylobacterium terrae TaxID=2665495 RepID=A0ABW4N8G8_9CAUL
MIGITAQESALMSKSRSLEEWIALHVRSATDPAMSDSEVRSHLRLLRKRLEDENLSFENLRVSRVANPFDTPIPPPPVYNSYEGMKASLEEMRRELAARDVEVIRLKSKIARLEKRLKPGPVSGLNTANALVYRHLQQHGAAGAEDIGRALGGRREGQNFISGEISLSSVKNALRRLRALGLIRLTGAGKHGDPHIAHPVDLAKLKPDQRKLADALLAS